MTPRYLVVVQPPKGFGRKFEFPEWDYADALRSLDRYRRRGWPACIVDHGSKYHVWEVNRHAGHDYDRKLERYFVAARSADEALMTARAEDPGYDTVQRCD